MKNDESRLNEELKMKKEELAIGRSNRRYTAGRRESDSHPVDGKRLDNGYGSVCSASYPHD